MRIIGGKDYYDNAGQFGIDPAHVFVRHKQKILLAKDVTGEKNLPNGLLFEFSEWFQSYGRNKCIKPDDLNFDNFTLFFCGKLYQGVRVQNGIDAEYQFFFDKESFCSYMESLKYDFRDQSKFSYWYEKRTMPPVDYYRDKLIENGITIAIAWEPQHKEPASFMVDGFNLHDFQFQKIFPPFEAHQEIQMWISSSLSQNSSNMTEITDQVVKRDKHGFDSWSFKKQKET